MSAYPLLQFQDFGATSKVDGHSQLSLVHFQGEEVGEIVEDAIGRGAGVEEGTRFGLKELGHIGGRNSFDFVRRIRTFFK